MTQRKAERTALKAIRTQGWRYRPAKTGLVVYPPDGGRPVPLHLNHNVRSNAATNQLRQLRRRGLKL